MKADNILIISFASLLTIGLIMVASSSIYIAENLTGDPFFFVSKHMLFLGIGIICLLIFLYIPSDFFLRTDWLFLLLSLTLLIALFIPNIGTEVNGSLRWIDIGFTNIQPSEVIKFSIILYIAGYCYRRNHEISTLRSFMKPLALLTVISLLIMSQPDLGTSAIIAALVIGMLFYAGISLFQFILLLIVVISLGVIAVVYTPYRFARYLAYLDPFHPDVVLGSGYQLSNSLISIGQGGWFGVGLGNSAQKNFFLPESYTDFIFAVTVEELGVIGGIFLICMFLMLFYGILRVGWFSMKKERLFQSYICFGVFLLISIQVLFHISVNIGLIPTKGLTLPFISYGGTSLLVLMSLLGIVFRINNENKLI